MLVQPTYGHTGLWLWFRCLDEYGFSSNPSKIQNDVLISKNDRKVLYGFLSGSQQRDDMATHTIGLTRLASPDVVPAPYLRERHSN